MNQESQKNLDVLCSCLITDISFIKGTPNQTTVAFTKNPGNYKGQSAH